VLAFHISTMHLDLNSVVWKLACISAANRMDWGLRGWRIRALARTGYYWPAMTASGTEVIRKTRPRLPPRKDVLLWTDDRINLLQIIKIYRLVQLKEIKKRATSTCSKSQRISPRPLRDNVVSFCCSGESNWAAKSREKQRFSLTMLFRRITTLFQSGLKGRRQWRLSDLDSPGKSLWLKY